MTKEICRLKAATLEEFSSWLDGTSIKVRISKRGGRRYDLETSSGTKLSVCLKTLEKIVKGILSRTALSRISSVALKNVIETLLVLDRDGKELLKSQKKGIRFLTRLSQFFNNLGYNRKRTIRKMLRIATKMGITPRIPPKQKELGKKLEQQIKAIEDNAKMALGMNQISLGSSIAGVFDYKFFYRHHVFTTSVEIFRYDDFGRNCFKLLQSFLQRASSGIKNRHDVNAKLKMHVFIEVKDGTICTKDVEVDASGYKEI